MNWAVVMAGGRGTRFWPESRAKQPKPFLKLLGQRTLLEETIARLEPLFKPSQILIVLQSDLVSQARHLLKRIPPENILGEPIGRNTAPCCVYAASRIVRRDAEAKLVFLPADQYISPKSLFHKTLKTALKLADEKPVLLGMSPDSPNTGYGYLEVSRRKRKVNGISYFSVTRFHEKPTLAKAIGFLKKGNFFWNGGTFIWRLDTFMRAIAIHMPRLYPAFAKLQEKRLSEARLASIYRELPSISLDYGVMEKIRNVHCLLAPFDWKDLGGWLGLADFWPLDRDGNRLAPPLNPPGVGAGFKPAPTIFIKSGGNIVKQDKRLVALLGIQDQLIIDTRDALLICPRSRTEEIRDVVRELERRKAKKYL